MTRSIAAEVFLFWNASYW